jgi:hypothetical protein
MRSRVFDFLLALDLAPDEWQHAFDQAKGNSLYVGDVIDEVMIGLGDRHVFSRPPCAVKGNC